MKLGQEELRARLADRRIRRSIKPIISPKKLENEIPLSEASVETVARGRRSIEDILNGKNKRKIAIVGPCSIHNVDEAMEYASRLKPLADHVQDTFLLAIRLYWEKPRTITGWPGLIHDPDLNSSGNIVKGLRLARQLARDVAEIGVYAATEFLQTYTPQYLADFVSWAAIGARTSESQVHRYMASGLSMPVGFKNNTEGNIEVAVNGILAASEGHNFLGIDYYRARLSEVETLGNPNCHLVLRGGNGTPNYHAESVRKAQALLRQAKLPENIMIDCNHSNSGKDPARQPEIFDCVVQQIIQGNKGIIGVMLESNLNPGKQEIPKGLHSLSELMPGVSVTDACLGWAETEKLILQGYETLRKG